MTDDAGVPSAADQPAVDQPTEQPRTAADAWRSAHEAWVRQRQMLGIAVFLEDFTGWTVTTSRAEQMAFAPDIWTASGIQARDAAAVEQAMEAGPEAQATLIADLDAATSAFRDATPQIPNDADPVLRGTLVPHDGMIREVAYLFEGNEGPEFVALLERYFPSALPIIALSYAAETDKELPGLPPRYSVDINPNGHANLRDVWLDLWNRTIVYDQTVYAAQAAHAAYEVLRNSEGSNLEEEPPPPIVSSASRRTLLADTDGLKIGSPPVPQLGAFAEVVESENVSQRAKAALDWISTAMAIPAPPTAAKDRAVTALTDAVSSIDSEGQERAMVADTVHYLLLASEPRPEHADPALGRFIDGLLDDPTFVSRLPALLEGRYDHDIERRMLEATAGHVSRHAERRLGTIASRLTGMRTPLRYVLDDHQSANRVNAAAEARERIEVAQRFWAEQQECARVDVAALAKDLARLDGVSAEARGELRSAREALGAIGADSEVHDFRPRLTLPPSATDPQARRNEGTMELVTAIVVADTSLEARQAQTPAWRAARAALAPFVSAIDATDTLRRNARQIGLSYELAHAIERSGPFTGSHNRDGADHVTSGVLGDSGLLHVLGPAFIATGGIYSVSGKDHVWHEAQLRGRILDIGRRLDGAHSDTLAAGRDISDLARRAVEVAEANEIPGIDPHWVNQLDRQNAGRARTDALYYGHQTAVRARQNGDLVYIADSLGQQVRVTREAGQRTNAARGVLGAVGALVGGTISQNQQLAERVLAQLAAHSHSSMTDVPALTVAFAAHGYRRPTDGRPGPWQGPEGGASPALPGPPSPTTLPNAPGNAPTPPVAMSPQMAPGVSTPGSGSKEGQGAGAPGQSGRARTGSGRRRAGQSGPGQQSGVVTTSREPTSRGRATRRVPASGHALPTRRQRPSSSSAPQAVAPTTSTALTQRATSSGQTPILAPAAPTPATHSSPAPGDAHAGRSGTMPHTEGPGMRSGRPATANARTVSAGGRSPGASSGRPAPGRTPPSSNSGQSGPG